LLYRYDEERDISLSVNPILGVNYDITNNAFQRRVGARAFLNIGDRWSVYFNFRDVSENKAITSEKFLLPVRGGVVRNNSIIAVSDYSEMRGGISYNWDWGNISIIQEEFVWGNTIDQSIILSGRSPAVPQIKFSATPFPWLKFDYIHAWLNSDVLDPNGRYPVIGGDRLVFVDKYFAANMFTISAFPDLDISFGNSVVYSDIPVHPGYLIPFFFYRSIDHNLSSQDNNAGQNGQMFFDLSFRGIKNLHLFSSLFVDEVRLSTIFDKDEQRNQVGYKIGFIRSKLFGNADISFGLEYTRLNPYAYRHYIPATNYQSNTYDLGHYLGDNSKEWYGFVAYKPFRNLSLKGYTRISNKGEALPLEYGLGGQTGVSFLEMTIFAREVYGIQLTYVHNIDISASLVAELANNPKGATLFLPEHLQKDQSIISVNVNYGF